jgi:tetratricopeptide (TPR) repeat protein
LWGLSNIYSFTNRLETSIVYGEHSLALSRQLNLRQQMAFTLNDVARCHLFLGQLSQAQGSAREARQIWRELENQPMLADNLALASRIAIFRGHYDQALTYSDEAFEISQATDNVWGQSYSRFQVGNVYWDYGQPAEAITVTEDALRLSELAGFVAGQVVTQATLAVIYAGLGAAERGIELVDQALGVVATAAQFHRASILAAKAQIYLLHGNLAEAETALGQAKTDPNRTDIPIYFLPVILADSELALRQKDYARTVAITDDLLATLDKYGMRTYLSDGLYLQGQALLALGQEETAYDRLLEARAVAESIGLRRMLWPILFTLSQIKTTPTEAERLHQQAREIVAYIADHTPVDLRDSFLSMPAVRAVK